MTVTRSDPAAQALGSPDRRAERAFTWALLISGVRCALTYVLLPFATPLIGLAPGLGPVVGLAIGTVAVLANIVSLRRFLLSRHRLRKPMIVLHTAVLLLLFVLIGIDAMALISASV